MDDREDGPSQRGGQHREANSLGRVRGMRTREPIAWSEINTKEMTDA
jgi:hypothetical protein